MTRLVALYPRDWRNRYEEEFLSLLADRPPDHFDRIDIVRGAIDARLHPQATHAAPEPPDPLPYNGPWTIRRAGRLTLIGAFLWLATIVIAINGPIDYGDRGAYRDAWTAYPSFIASLILLVIGIWAVAATIPSASHVARTAALVAGLAALFWALAPWMVVLAVAMCLGITVLAIEAARTHRWRRSDVALLVAGIGAAVALIAIDLAGGPLPMHDLDVQFTVFLMLATLWFATADALLRPAVPIADPGVERPA
jgi:hypothetical protein